MSSTLPFIPVGKPHIGEAEITAMNEALRSGWLTAGPRVRQFEQAVAEYTGARHAVAVSSCTAALLLSLRASDIGLGDEVITSPLTFAATVNTILQCGATPVLADIDPRTYNLDPVAAEAAITPRTKALMPVHFAGQACDMDAFRALTAKHGLLLIEDAAHSFGASWQGEKIGGMGTRATCLSFYPTKNITTGEGGMVLTADEAFATRVRRLALHGISRDAWARAQAGAATWQYDIVEGGYKFNLTDPQAAMGLVQLPQLDGFTAERQALSAQYDALLAEVEEITLPFVDAQGLHARHIYPVQVPAARRDELIQGLHAAGIGTTVHYIPIHHHSHFQAHLPYRPGDFLHTDAYFSRALTLPLYVGMGEEAVNRVCKRLRRLLEK